ncbi:rCG58782 [Rattus norvegicus]|uniref:RCG58782 n=1 Tax=Rattus norvegicus TaxID=10116 RepID=A6JL45_RAT|nr:rCG58782 [Rattus norvegicus]
MCVESVIILHHRSTFPASDCTGFSGFTSTVGFEHAGAVKGPSEHSSVLVVCLSAAMETGNQSIHPDPCQRRTFKKQYVFIICFLRTLT